MKKVIIELIGWFGAAALFAGYVLVSFNLSPPDGFVYQFLNFSGALGLGIIALTKKAYPNVIVNVFWGVVALIAFIRLLIV